MCRAIAAVCAVDKIAKIYAKALAHYARQREDIEPETWVSEIRLRACIRIGELSQELEKRKPTVGRFAFPPVGSQNFRLSPMPGSAPAPPPLRHPGALCSMDNSPHAGAGNTEPLADLDRAKSLVMQSPDLGRLTLCRRGAAFVFALALRLSDAFALAFQHDLAFPRRHAGQDRQHQLAGWVARVEPFTAHVRITRPTRRLARSVS